MSDPVLHLSAVAKVYNQGLPSEVRVLDGLDLNVASGEAVALVAPSGAGSGGEAGDTMPEKTLKQVLAGHATRLLSLPGVVGVGEGLCGGAPCIKVFVTGKTPALVREIGSEIEGYPVEIVESGEFRTPD